MSKEGIQVVGKRVNKVCGIYLIPISNIMIELVNNNPTTSTATTTSKTTIKQVLLILLILLLLLLLLLLLVLLLQLDLTPVIEPTFLWFKWIFTLPKEKNPINTYITQGKTPIAWSHVIRALEPP